MDKRRRDSLAAWASILSFAIVVAGKAWELLTVSQVLFYELGLLTIGIVCGGLWLRWKWQEFMDTQRAFIEWASSHPDTDQEAKNDKNLYQRINRLAHVAATSKVAAHESNKHAPP